MNQATNHLRLPVIITSLNKQIWWHLILMVMSHNGHNGRYNDAQASFYHKQSLWNYRKMTQSSSLESNLQVITVNLLKKSRFNFTLIEFNSSGRLERCTSIFISWMSVRSVYSLWILKTVLEPSTVWWWLLGFTFGSHFHTGTLTRERPTLLSSPPWQASACIKMQH